jgi:hypothetical protein
VSFWTIAPGIFRVDGMPRIGMHHLFYGKKQVKLFEGNKSIEKVLREQSIKVCSTLLISTDSGSLTRMTARKDLR